MARETDSSVKAKYINRIGGRISDKLIKIGTSRFFNRVSLASLPDPMRFRSRNPRNPSRFQGLARPSQKSDPMPEGRTPRREFLGSRAGWPEPTGRPTKGWRLKEKGNWRVVSRRRGYRSGHLIGSLVFGAGRAYGRVFGTIGGMTAGVDFLQLFDGDFGVDRRRVQLLVSEQLLDVTNVGPVFQHVRGARMPQDVAAALVFESGPFQPGRHHARKHVGIEGVAVAGQEQGLGARVQAQARAHFGQVAFQPLDGPPAHRHHAVFVPFAPHMQRAPLGVEAGQFQAAKLGAAQTARVKEFQDGPVAHAQRVGHVGHGHEAVDFGQRQHFLVQSLFRPGQLQLAGRIGQEDVLPGEPSEPVLEAA